MFSYKSFWDVYSSYNKPEIKKNHKNLLERLFLNYQYALSDKEKMILKKLNDESLKPTIVVVYKPSDGIAYTDQAIKHFKNKEINVVGISSESDLTKIKITDYDGIFLPGGPDIHPSQERTVLEQHLIQESNNNDIPLVGICRGMQILGKTYNYKISDIVSTHRDSSWGYTFNNTVIVKKGSHLYYALLYKLNSETTENVIEYDITCLHHQHCSSLEELPLKVTATNKRDNLIEAVEKRIVNYLQYGLQHHPEDVINKCKLERKERIRKIEYNHKYSLSKIKDEHEKSLREIEHKLEKSKRKIKNEYIEEFKKNENDYKKSLIEIEVKYYDKLFDPSDLEINIFRAYSGLTWKNTLFSKYNKKDNQARKDYNKDLEKAQKDFDKDVDLAQKNLDKNIQQAIEEFNKLLEQKPEKSKDEKAARAELGLFVHQVRQHFLENQEKTQQQNNEHTEEHVFPVFPT